MQGGEKTRKQVVQYMHLSVIWWLKSSAIVQYILKENYQTIVEGNCKSQRHEIQSN